MNFKLTKGSLNFKVYTSPTIPASGTENDIVIISSTPMENWILSSDSPTGEPRNNGDVWIQYSVSGNVFDIMNQHDFMLAITKIYQYISGTWVTVDARRYVGGVWDVVSSAFSATINITYPANSNCVVTNSGGQTVASDTNAGSSSKTWTATVGAIGTYTVTATATDGSGKSKSQNVSITADDQSVNVALLYRNEYYMHGVEKIPLEAILDREGNYGSVTENATSVHIDSGGFNVAVGYISSNSVDLSKVHTLYCKITNITGQTSRSDIGLRLSVCDTKIGYKNGAGRTDTAVVDIPANTLTDDICSLDVSSLDSGYIGVYSYGVWDGSNHGVAFDMTEFYAT